MARLNFSYQQNRKNLGLICLADLGNLQHLGNAYKYTRFKLYYGVNSNIVLKAAA